MTDEASLTKNIGVVVGSLRSNSNSGAVAQGIVKLLPPGLEGQLVLLGDLPMYNQDFDDPALTPAAYVAFRMQMQALDGIIFVTPEYNRSMPAVLKNALDIGSRPMGQSAWVHKPCAIVSNSPGPIGGFGSNQHLKQVLGFLNFRIMQQPEMYLGGIGDSLDENGEPTERTQAFLQKFVDAFAAWIIAASAPILSRPLCPIAIRAPSGVWR